MDANAAATLKVPKFVWWMIWAAMTSAIVIYAVVLQASGRSEGTENEADLKNILLPIAIVAVIASFLIRFLLTKRLANSDDDKKRALSFSSYIVSLALADSAAVYGLVLGLTGVPFNDYIAFFGIGFLAIILQPPTVLYPSKEEDYLDKLRGR